MADAATLARHLELGEQPGQAAHYALQAGLAARHVYAHVEARQWSDRALALLEREASCLADPQAITANLLARVEALNLRGWALRLVGDMAANDADLEEEGWVPLGDLGAAAAALGDGEMARRCLEHSLALARQVADRTQEILDLGHLGWLELQEGKAGAAREHLVAALALA